MANRRMFSLDIVDTDKFLEMPSSAQALYFHLGMRADDDGFLSSPRKITASIGANNDDLKLLIAKGFLIVFDDGVCVVTDWKINNYIQKDRYRKTHYIEHLNRLKQRENGSYMLLDTECIQNVYSLDTQVRLELGKDRLGEDRLGEDSIYNDCTSQKNRSEKTNDTPKKQKHKYGEYKNVLLTDEEIEKLQSQFPNDWENRIENLSEGIELKGYKYKNHYLAIIKWANNENFTTYNQNKEPSKVLVTGELPF